MKKLTINLFACLIIGMGGLTLMQPSESVALSGAAFATMAECEDEHGEMKGEIVIEILAATACAGTIQNQTKTYYGE